MNTAKERSSGASRRLAVFSMDVEDWYHLDYFDRRTCRRDLSLLDGIEVYRDLLAEERVPSTYFVLGELAASLSGLLRELAADGADVGSHGWDHRRPLTMPVNEVEEDLRKSRAELEQRLQRPVLGYRAPCFSLDRARLERLRAVGYLYDSSRIDFGDHPLYGTLKLDGFERVGGEIYREGGFVEFEVSTLPVGGKRVPVSGGGYLRLLPWTLTRLLVGRYLRDHQLYTLYIHPFELSRRPDPPLPAGTKWTTRRRFSVGRTQVADRLRRLIALLRSRGFEFSTFARLRADIMGAGPAPAGAA